ncbi:cyclic pyranopterin monophosphate synthase MoaC [Roseibium sp. SCPC15]|uniref:cyclic pyranopterin monophosphate synthase MoaC n=1 Tax=Roseibium sp. SCP15 TaxID=3141376 RepID=UPI00333929D9
MSDQDPKLTHLDEAGAANMVDVSQKEATHRIAIARGTITMRQETLDLIRSGNAKKGDVIGTARIAGILAAKKTHELIPLCHPLMLSKVTIDIDVDDSLPGLAVTATTKVSGQTGVEMEALTACSLTCLTIYDMAKAVDRGMVIGDIRLVEKAGGKSGHWTLEKDGSEGGT